MTFKEKLDRLVGKTVRYGSHESGGPGTAKLLEVGENCIVLEEFEGDVIVPFHSLAWVKDLKKQD